MTLSWNRDSILEALKALAKADPKFRLFGSDGHGYKLNPPLDAAVLDEFERRYVIKLPADYRYFLTQVGDGGAGPTYGVFKFGEHDDGYGYRKWDGGYLVGNVTRPFRHLDAWNHTAEFWSQRPEFDNALNEDEEDRLWEAWDQILEREYWHESIMDGAIPICHLGCAARQWLVVNGPQHGFVWNDDRAGDRGLSPTLDAKGLPMSFSNWYLDWLRESATQLKID